MRLDDPGPGRTLSILAKHHLKYIEFEIKGYLDCNCSQTTGVGNEKVSKGLGRETAMQGSRMP